jgi:hypothetical protein
VTQARGLGEAQGKPWAALGEDQVSLGEGQGHGEPCPAMGGAPIATNGLIFWPIFFKINKVFALAALRGRPDDFLDRQGPKSFFWASLDWAGLGFGHPGLALPCR